MPRKVSLFPEDRLVESSKNEVIHVRVNQMRLERPRQWGACRMAFPLWNQLQLDRYWVKKLLPGREGNEGSVHRCPYSIFRRAVQVDGQAGQLAGA